MLVAIVLAAGKGTRMRSDLPKVLHELDGDPLVFYPLRLARAAGAECIVVVVGHGADAVRERVERDLVDGDELEAVEFVEQKDQRGTGHAVQCALPAVPEAATEVLILSGDVPLLRSETLTTLRDACRASAAKLALATFRPVDPSGYGRIIRTDESIAIREHRDASPEELEIDECNAGIYCVDAQRLRAELPKLDEHDVRAVPAGRIGFYRQEIYLTDLVERLAELGAVATVEVEADEVAGVNTPEQLAALERIVRTRKPTVLQ